ncbi:hypothetical protein C2E23DRAFT_887407 [Lenzites betulinus]|nr:hypothetical protein C2E23DRAFT_887407 [Lenzites betulinus]
MNMVYLATDVISFLPVENNIVAYLFVTLFETVYGRLTAILVTYFLVALQEASRASTCLSSGLGF